MEKFSALYFPIFEKVIDDYHQINSIDASEQNPYEEGSIEFLLYRKCWIDTVQWHLEDEIREPQILPEEGMKLKRMIDRSNQKRTDIVEQLDDYYYVQLNKEEIPADAKLNTESPAWAIDRLSILALKIYHMRQETERTDADAEHVAKCCDRLDLLLQQRTDLSKAIDDLFDDYKNGRKYMKVYRQVKMYNDPSMNPVLYKGKK